MQTQSALNESRSALKIECVRSKKILSGQRWFRSDFFWNNAVQRWNFQFWTILIQTKLELIRVRVNFGHHMRVGFCLWTIELARVMRKMPHFGIGIVWRVIPMSFPVFWISISGRSLNSYGTSPNLWVQKELVKFRQGTQDTWLCFAKFLREFFGYSPLNLLGDLGDVIFG